jgi:hypothetical protein
MNAWQLQDTLSRRLLQWAGFSMLAGLLMWLSGRPFWRGAGIQFASWGFIDGLIALFGQAASQQRLDRLENPGASDVLEKEAHNLRRILLINVGLDVLYILGGRWWANRDGGDEARQGHGTGVMIQGAFLLIFDLFHTLRLKDSNDD